MSIFKLFHYYESIFSHNNHIRISDKEVAVKSNEFPYLKISDSQIELFKIDILPKLKNDNRGDWERFNAYREFLERIDKHFIKLNHLGFGYRVTDIETELVDIRSHLTAGFELVEEKSGDEANNRWFFIRHKTDRTVPKIELVLYLSDKYRDYCPQFQFDIDTDLDFESIKKITDELLSKDFFFWQYDIPNYGIVMAMGKIGQINGVNILAGIGTDLRKPQNFSKI